ncbi:glutathione peroxidase 1-like [Aphidius gifuensis]|uniref:glutathione peroxidase 1-like n=1 Tax=Aphidius gifuensis TaxID=684658 RepID=UPI001CDCCC9D|nr:glutathione peroxidase 1-like [Aphidius gifuensis]
MQKLTIVLLSIVVLASAGPCENGKDNCMSKDNPFNQDTDWEKATDIYQFHAKDIMGNDVSLDKYRDNVLIVVNVASKCTLTDGNYKQLVELFDKYEKDGLRILAFPCNQFNGQEPGTSQQIMDFVKGYKVRFDMFEKIDVNGDNAHPLYKWLKSKQGGVLFDFIKWNFTKFIINKKGQAIERLGPTTEPTTMENKIKSQL